MTRSESYQQALALGYSGSIKYPRGSKTFWDDQILRIQRRNFAGRITAFRRNRRATFYRQAINLGYAGQVKYPKGSTGFWQNHAMRLQAIADDNEELPPILDVIQLRLNADSLLSAESFRSILDRHTTSGITYTLAMLDQENAPVHLTNARTFTQSAIWRKYYDLHAIMLKFLDEGEYNRIRRPEGMPNPILPRDAEHWNLTLAIFNSPSDFPLPHPNPELLLQLIPEVNDNPPLQNLRDGVYNCVLKPMKDYFSTHGKKRFINFIEKYNIKHFDNGISHEQLQEIANKTWSHLVFYDKSKKIWNDYKPTSQKTCKKFVFEVNNSHAVASDDARIEQGSIPTQDAIYDPDDDDDVASYRCITENLDELEELEEKEKEPPQIEWFDTSDELYEAGKNLCGQEIISKGNLVAICHKVRGLEANLHYKKKFHQYEEFPECFTDAGVGKAKFLLQHPEFKFGTSANDPYLQILNDSDISGYYERNEKSNYNNHKYDMNHAYKSFKSSGLFRGFPIIESIHSFDKPFSQLKNFKHGLVYLDGGTEGSMRGWQPVELVKGDPHVMCVAHGHKSFDVDFSEFTNSQFRSFIGKCSAKTYDSVWRTTDPNEFLRARYVLRDKITCVSQNVSVLEEKTEYVITYASDRKPWSFPIISAYVKAHQKHQLFKQLELLKQNNITPVYVSVDGIETKENCDALFNIGLAEGQWKKENINVVLNCTSIRGKIQREQVEHPPLNEMLTWKKENRINGFWHYAGAAGNGKTHTIVQFAKSYRKSVYMAPSNAAVDNLLEMAKRIGVPIHAFTFHSVFGIGCKESYIDKYTHFFLDECSMASGQLLGTMLGRLRTWQSFIMAGDFCQLPPPQGMIISASHHYEQFKKRTLTKNWRQNEDPEFFALCNSLRGKIKKDDVMDIIDKLNKLYCDKLPEVKSMDDIYIAGTNKQVDDANLRINEGCEYKIDSKIICKKTVFIDKKKISNGKCGIVINLDPFTIRWANNTVSQIPKKIITLAFALTVHKAQGQTKRGNVIINPSRLFAKNHLYVALTRATKSSNVYFNNIISRQTFMRTVNT